MKYLACTGSLLILFLHTCPGHQGLSGGWHPFWHTRQSSWCSLRTNCLGVVSEFSVFLHDQGLLCCLIMHGQNASSGHHCTDALLYAKQQQPNANCTHEASTRTDARSFVLYNLNMFSQMLSRPCPLPPERRCCCYFTHTTSLVLCLPLQRGMNL